MDDMTMGLFIFFGSLIGLAIVIFLSCKLFDKVNQKYLIKHPRPAPPAPIMRYCTACGSTGVPLVRDQGSDVVFVLLILFFLIPGIIYAAWRSSTRQLICPRCGHASMIPLDSPLARHAVHDCRGEKFCEICGRPMAAEMVQPVPAQPVEVVVKPKNEKSDPFIRLKL